MLNDIFYAFVLINELFKLFDSFNSKEKLE
jgi:hypothetical protein